MDLVYRNFEKRRRNDASTALDENTSGRIGNGTYRLIAHRSLADVERGLARCSSIVGRITSSEIFE